MAHDADRRARRTRGVFSDAGVTLIELLTVVSLLSVVVAAAYMLFGSASAMSDQLEARAAAMEENRKGMYSITRELRQAVEITDAGGAFQAAQPRQCEFYTDVDDDGAPELVKYRVHQGQLLRSVFEPTTQVAPYTFGATGSAEQAIISSIDGSWNGNIFTYYDRSDPPAEVNNGHKEDASAVSLRLINYATVNHKTAFVDLSTWVKIRSIHNSID